MLNVLNSKIAEFRSAEVIGNVIDNSYMLKRVDDGNGRSAVQIADGSAGEDIVGIAHVNPIAATRKAVIKEPHNINASNIVTLLNSSIDAASVRVYNTTTAALMPAADYGVVNNVITWTANFPAVTDELEIDYLRNITLQELSDEGLPLDFANIVNGSDGGVEFATGLSTLETDFYDTTVAYTIGNAIYVDAEGKPSSVAVAGDSFGTCAVVPTSGNPSLGITFSLNF